MPGTSGKTRGWTRGNNCTAHTATRQRADKRHSRTDTKTPGTNEETPLDVGKRLCSSSHLSTNNGGITMRQMQETPRIILKLTMNVKNNFGELMQTSLQSLLSVDRNRLWNRPGGLSGHCGLLILWGQFEVVYESLEYVQVSLLCNAPRNSPSFPIPILF
jgi:hypothetical protein